MVRHGQTPKNAKGELTGTLDVPLNGRGVRQAAAIGVRLAELQLAEEISSWRVYTSTMKRTLQTTEIAACTGHFSNIPIQVASALDPLDYGDLQGKDRNILLQFYGPDRYMEFRRGSVAPPNGNGESFDCAAERVREFWRKFVVLDLLYGRDVLMVLHGSGLAAMVETLEGRLASAALRDHDHTTLHVYKFEVVFETVPGRSSPKLLTHYTLDAAPLVQEESFVPAEPATMSLTMAAP
ncbi:MAG: histidine phosphatase family protein [Candidatus Marsarchaeota archaeon]|nr:histidine phosphatase family protein [Candidatus Marsarchaeota archaeon]